MHIRNITLGTLGACAAVAIGLTLGVFVFSPGSSTDLRPETTAALSNDASGGTSQGLKVQGDWTLRILEADGTLVQEQRFHNDLTEFGQQILARYLTQQYAPGAILISLRGGNNPPCLASTGRQRECNIVYPNTVGVGSDSPHVFKTMTSVTEPVEGSNSAERVVLSGTATAAFDGVISSVATRIYYCNPLVIRTEDCGISRGQDSADFTSTDITPINVVEGQIIQAQVIINFS